MKKITATVIFGLIAAVSVFFSVTVQKRYNEKYVHTTARLIYEEKRTKLPSDFTYLYSADGKNYNAKRTGTIKISKRNISYNRALPSDYYFGYIALPTKILFFIGTLSAMLAVYAFFSGILNLSFADKLPPCIFLYYIAGLAFITESETITLSMALFTLAIIAVYVTAKKQKGYY